MTDKELMQMALDALIDAADSQNWEMQQNIDQHGEWYRRSVYLKQATTNSQAAIEALRIRLSQCERCGEVNPAEIHTCSPQEPLPAKSKGALSHEENKRHNKMILDKFYEENAHLYTAPPQREWQGLTGYEFVQIRNNLKGDDLDLARAIEAKLKEKNSA